MSSPIDGLGSRDRIIDAATTLFAERGYDATSTRAIADAVGLNIATVAYHVGGKSDLYREVMRRAHVAQHDSVVAALTEFEAGEPTAEGIRAALHHFVDAYLTFCITHPQVPALWMRRWLAEGDELDELAQEFIGPLVSQVGARVRARLEQAGIAADVDVELLVYTIVWTTHAFSKAGVVDGAGNRVPPTDVANLQAFRRHLHRLVDGTLSLPVRG